MVFGKRPTDRFFTPNEKNNESKGRTKLTCPQSECADPKYRSLLESDPLVKSEAGGKKYLDLPTPFFKAKQIPFKEIPLFAITEHHAKLS